MKNLIFIFACFSIFAFMACNDEASIYSVDEMEDIQSTDRSPNAFPDLIFLPTGFEAEGIEIGNGNDVYVSAIAYSPSPIYVGAIWKGDLRTGVGSILYPPDGLPSVGLKFDSRTNWLYICKPYGALVLDASSGDVINTYYFDFTGDAVINDVILTKKAAYFTDSYNARIFKVPLTSSGQPNGPAEEIPLPDFEYVFDPAFFAINMNGIVASPNGKYLIVNNMTTGKLYLIDTKNNYATQVISISNFDLVDFQWGDGLLLDGHTLYICKNMPNKIGVITLSPDLKSGTFVEDLTDPVNFHEPATIAQKGSNLYAVNAYFDDTFFNGIDPTTQTMEIVKVPK